MIPRRLLLATPALLAAPARATIPELVLWGPPAGPTITLAAAVSNGFLDGVATRLSVRAWRDPDELRAGIASGTMQAAVMPTVVAANLFNRGLGVRLLNVMTDGLLAIVAAEPIADLTWLRGRTLALPFRNDTPEFVFNRLARAAGMDPARDIRIQTAGTPAEAAQLLIAGRVEAAVLAEPATTAALLGAGRAGRTLVRAFDLQEAFGRLTGHASLPQAGLAVRDTLLASHAEGVAALQAGLVRATAYVRANPGSAAQVAAPILNLPPPVIAQSIPHSRLVAHAAREARPALEAYFRTVAEAEPGILGGRLPAEAFYL